MNSTQMNQSLKDLYEQKIGSLIQMINSDPSLSDPLLLSVDEKYSLSQTKIMIVGQETHKWEWSQSDAERDPGYPINKPYSEYVSILMARYQRKHWRKFFNDSPFWKAADHIYEKLNNYPDRPDIGYIWNNIDKVDCDGGPLSALTRKKVWDCFFVLDEELKITKPDVVIFFVGQRYDALLEEMNYKISPISEKMKGDFEWFAKIEREGILPEQSYILAHPNRLQRSKKGAYLDTVINLITQV